MLAGSAWLLMCCLVVSCCLSVILLYRMHPRRSHMRWMGASVVLMAVSSTYAILTHAEPVYSPEAIMTLLAFVCAFRGLTIMLFEHVGKKPVRWVEASDEP